MNTNMQPTKNSNVRANCAETTASNIKTIELKINNVIVCPNPQLTPMVRPSRTDVVFDTQEATAAT